MSQFHHLYNTSRWRKLRAHHLASEPLCRPCRKAGLTTVADTVDHIVKHDGDLALFHDPANLQSTCRTCHSGDKQRQEKSGSAYFRGCHPDGTPLDPKHHWKAEGRIQAPKDRTCKSLHHNEIGEGGSKSLKPGVNQTRLYLSTRDVNSKSSPFSGRSL